MKQCTLFGNPVAHSLSPKIHSQFASQTGEELSYNATLVAEDAFAAALDHFYISGGVGANVTLPFKEQAYQQAYRLSPRAKQAGAVNTLIRTEKGWNGDNTDGAGFMADLARLGWPVKGARVLVLGAGGAVRGILGPLLAEQPVSVIIANRTFERALQLAEDFGQPCHAISLDDLPEQEPFDLLVNAISAGHQGDACQWPGSLLHEASHCYDLSYGTAARPFLDWAQKHDCQQVSDGLGMLVGQAAESFYLWTGKKPEIGPVLEQLWSENGQA